MKLRQTHSIAVAAAKSSISSATAYRIDSDNRLPSQKKLPRERRRPDPLVNIFDAEVVPILQSSPGIRSVALYEGLPRFEWRWPMSFEKALRDCVFDESFNGKLSISRYIDHWKTITCAICSTI
jgi:hypothetical protein